jgi:hypothetical protein
MGVEAGGGLVKQQNFRVHGQGARQARALAHAPAQLGGHVVLHPAQPHQVQLDAGHDADGGLFQLRQLAQGQRDVLFDGQGIEERGTLEQHPDLPPDEVEPLLRHVADIVVLDVHVTGGGRLQADEVAQERGLAGPAAAQDDHGLPRLDLQVHAVQDTALAIVRDEVRNTNDGAGEFVSHSQPV